MTPVRLKSAVETMIRFESVINQELFPVCAAGYQSLVNAAEYAPPIGPGPVSDGQFYSPPESPAGLHTTQP